MKFVVNTKTLINAVSLGIISSNINRFDRKSTSVQISADEKYLTIILELNTIHSQVSIVGVGTYDENENKNDIKKNTKIVDVSMFKQLALSFDTEETEFDFIENGIELHSGKSKFVLPQIVDCEDMMFSSPDFPNETDAEIEFNKQDWDFIKNNQLYSLSKVFTRPVYTYMYVDNYGNVIAGDMDDVLFTLSHKLNLRKTCLLSNNIINLFNAVPSDAKLVEHEDKFIITLNGEGFSYISEFTPKYEGDDDIGNYNADIILSLMQIPEENYGSVEPSPINKFLSQISFMSESIDDRVKFIVNNDKLTLLNKNQNQSSVQIGGDCPDFELEFNLNAMKEVIANYNSEEINLSPLYDSEGILAGILVWNDDLVTMLTGMQS